MIYPNKNSWHSAKHRRISLIGMSGLGKTYLSNILRASGDWFHYSVDYRIGTRYMGEHIVDNFKREAMQLPYLRELLLSDSIYIASNITFENLAPLSAYLGKPGDTSRGGIPFDEYMRRQDLHRAAEIAATIDTAHFINRAHDIYEYDNFVCDTSGSICEVVDPNDPNDPVLKALSENSLIVWLRGNDQHIETLVERFNRAPKPMYAAAPKMRARWSSYLDTMGLEENQVDPDAFIRWSYQQILDDRLPLYAGIADKWGIAIDAEDLSGVTTAKEFNDIIESHLPD